MQIVVYLMIALFVGYLITSYSIIGHLTYSISRTFYDLPDRLKWLFWVFGFGIGVGAMAVGQLAGDWTYAVSGFLMCCVPVAARYRSDKNIAIIHNLGAVGSIAVACFGLVFAGAPGAFYWGAGGQAILWLGARTGLKNTTYFIECWWFGVVCFFLLHHY